MGEFMAVWQEVEAMQGKLIDIEKARLVIAKLTPPRARRFAVWLCYYKEPIAMSKPIEEMHFSELIRIPDEQRLENYLESLGIAFVRDACEAAGKEDFGLLIIKELTRRKRQEIICKNRMVYCKNKIVVPLW